VRFRTAHKAAAFLLAITSIFTLASAGVLSSATLILIVLGVGLSWHTDPGTLLGAWIERATPLLNAVVLVFLAFAVFQVGRSFPEVDLSPFLGFVLFLLVVKLCQRRSNRDYLQVFIMSFLVMLAASWMATGVIFILGFGLYVVLATWALILFHLRREIEDNYIVRHASESRAEQVTATRVLNSRRVVGLPFFATTGAIALAVLIGSSLVFALVPRVGLGFILGGVRRQVGIAGFTDEVKLGMHGLISSDNQTVVLRSEIPSIAGLANDQEREHVISGLYWRGTVYDVYDQGQWLRSRADKNRTQLLPSQLVGDTSRSYELADPYAGNPPLGRKATLQGTFEQTVEIVALTHPVAFALDRPVFFETLPIPIGSFTATDFEARWSDEVSLRMFRVNPANPYDRRQAMTDFLGARYRVFSRDPGRGRSHSPHAPIEQLPPGTLDSYLRVPPTLAPRMSALASQIMAKSGSPAAKAQAVVDWLKRTHGYTTNLKRDERIADPLEDFLFAQDAGHCEYFASAAALLLRLGGVPTRYINGFLGGEWNAMRGTVTVRENRAHSWVEAYLGREGWVRIDATPSLARPSHMGTLRQVFDSAELFWGRWVVEYSASQQFLLAQRLGQKLGLRSHGYLPGRAATPLTRKQALALAGLVTMAVVIISQRKRFKGWRKARAGGNAQETRADQAIVRLYQALLRRLSSAGIPRRPSETPHEYLARIREAGLEGAPAFQRLTDAYTSVRYGEMNLQPELVADLRREAPQIRLAE
jgi:transglutaminase-like putative cysteine protease